MAATNGHSESQDEVMEHDEFMALHQNNGSNNAPSPSEQAHLIDNVVESELETDDKGLENLSAKDFPLSNYDDEVDTVEFKWLQEILNMFSKARHPHPDSAMQGLARAWAVGDPDVRLEALGLDDVADELSRTVQFASDVRQRPVRPLVSSMRFDPVCDLIAAVCSILRVDLRATLQSRGVFQCFSDHSLIPTARGGTDALAVLQDCLLVGRPYTATAKSIGGLLLPGW